MKFSNGCWLNKEGIETFSPANAYRIKKEAQSVTILAPHKSIAHRGDTLGGPVLSVKLSSPMPEVIRVQIQHFSGAKACGPYFEINESPTDVQIKDEASLLTFSTGALKVEVSKEDKDWSMNFFNQSTLLTSTGFRNIAYIKTDQKETFMREQLSLTVGELVYGLGERFTPFVKNGQTIEIWNEDGGTSTEQSYKNIPFYMTNKGYGIFVNHPEHVSFEVGSEKVTRVQFSVPGEALDYFIINGPSLEKVLENYTKLTGRPALPPAWSFGLWLTTSFTTNYDEQTVTSFIDGMAERDIPLHVFHFDCFWMKGFNWCDFTWDEEVFPDPVNMIKRLKSKGLKICVWINSYIAQESSLFAEGVEGGYLIKKPNGDTWQWDMWQPGMGIVDFTNPAACEWYASKLQLLIDMGVDCFKTDFGERIPTDVVYYDGSDPFKMHNYYSFLYNKVVFDLLVKNFGEKEAVLFARSATAGGQQFPVHWGGDCTSVFESMAESLRGGLSLCMSGFGFWSHDIGGFESTSTADVYKRWAAFGLLSSHSRLHGSSSYRVPWLYDEEAVEVVSFFSKLKCTLMPYIYKNANITAQTGVPMMRSMPLSYQKDPVCAYIDLQYMLGDSLMVAPIFNDSGDVSYYLPAGLWTNFLTNERVSGGQYQVEHHDYKSLPIMVKPNSIIAVGQNNSKPDYDYVDGVTYHLFELEEGETAGTEIYNISGEIESTFKTTLKDGLLTIDLQNNHKPYRILLRNRFGVTTFDALTLKEDAYGTEIIAPSTLTQFSIQMI